MPGCRVVYADRNPVVLSHAKALLASGPDGATAYVDADLRDPETILAAAALAPAGGRHAGGDHAAHR